MEWSALSAAVIAKARVTPVPDASKQVVNEVSDAVETVTETTSSVVKLLPTYLTRAAMAAGVIIAGILLLRLIRFIIFKTVRARANADPEVIRRKATSRSIISSMVGYLWYFLIIGVVLGIFGLDITSILAAAGVVGIAVAFGAQTMVQDILSGLFMWGEGSVKVGDVVTLNELSGTVESISIRTTTIRNFNGNLIVIPNGEIRAVTNMSRGFKRAIVNVPCPYEANHERLMAILREEMEIAAREIEGIEATPEIMSIVSFDPNAVMVQIAAPCPIGEHWRIERDIRSRIKARFDKEGIIMPHYNYPVK